MRDIFKPQDLFEASDYTITLKRYDVCDVVGTARDDDGNHKTVVNRTVHPEAFTSTMHGDPILIKQILDELDIPKIGVCLVAQVLYPEFNVFGFSRTAKSVLMLMKYGVDVTDELTKDVIDSSLLPVYITDEEE